ncbi:hypothetical protein BJ878DRAFT_245907 [Calycina marina]|uniref:Uncharacterized protein n=1 Tax=Calycina marina TaxID=1763456 RepID=A0A9P8CDD1_9HELO|nr:hypothetical protein BJ878DRAFT_245907 [Calycina marina]
MPSTIVTVGGWVFMVVAGAVIYRTSRKAGKRVALNAAELRREKAKLARENTVVEKHTKSEKSEKKTEKKPKQNKAPDSEPAWLSNDAVEVDPREELDNKAFAKRLQSVKAGTTLKQAATTAGRQKSVKQSRAQEKEVSSDNTAPSSNAGGDADDDQSPINSPKFGATEDHSSVGGGVSDMLEAPGPGPKVLKVTSPTNPAPANKQKTVAAAAPVMTKKQRQNQKKSEEASLAKADAEKERKKQEEKQRRTAREAEGRAAKDGSSFLASKAPAASVWTPGSSNGNVASKTELLDTYETAPKAEASTTASSEEWQNLPSEEEQLKRAMEESSDWQEVLDKKKKNKTAKPIGESKDAVASVSSEGEQSDKKPKKKPAPTPLQKTNTQNANPFRAVQDTEWEV